MTGHHAAPEIVVHRDPDGDWKRIGLADDHGQKIELSLAHLYRPAETVQSDGFPLSLDFGGHSPTLSCHGLTLEG